MDDQNIKKISVDLRMALQLTSYERQKTLDLNVGYDNGYWEIVIRYVGELELIKESIPFTYSELLANYAIINIKEEYIYPLSLHPSIIFIDKPREIFSDYINEFRKSNREDYLFRLSEIRSAICINNSIMNELKGQGTLIAIVDSGINTEHEVFYDENGEMRIEVVYDETVDGNPPYNYTNGFEYRNTFGQISNDTSGHGTAIAGIIAGLAPGAKIIVVKMKQNTIGLMQGIDYAIRYAIEQQKPLVINISYGNNYGGHDGDSLLENYIDNVSSLYRVMIVVGMGNEGNTNRHSFVKAMNNTSYESSIYVSPYCTSINIQLWKNFYDNILYYLKTPSGITFGPIYNRQDIYRFTTNSFESQENMSIEILYGYPTPINSRQETYITIIPQNIYIEEGIWSIEMYAKEIINGEINIWLPTFNATSSNVEFLSPTEDTTFTIPASSKAVLSVGSYNDISLQYATFSGRGYTVNNIIKPELCAPGMNIITTGTNNDYISVTGTSFSVPIVCAGASLLMEYGIVDQNDVFLYGERLKSVLLAGAKKLPGETTWPNNKLGFGSICVLNSLVML